MRKFKLLSLLGLLLCGSALWSQPEPEGAHRIRKAQFPSAAYERLEPHLSGVKKLRYYREIDPSGIRFEARFRKARLQYRVAFDPDGTIEQTAFGIEPPDLPSDTWDAVREGLQARVGAYRVLAMWQVYPGKSFGSEVQLFRNTYQNLMLPEIRYGLTLRTTATHSRKTLEAVFDSSGVLLSLRDALPPNYDHVLY